MTEPTTPRPGPVPAWLGAALEPVYRFEIGRRNRAYDRGRGVERVDRPVVSVGNLSVGGTGKTPTVRWVVETLVAAGRRPCVAMRGYKSTPAVESDEAAELRRTLPGVPVVARPDRAQGLRALFATDVGAAVDCVVLDDGFQHRRLGRDLDIVLVDASRDPFADRLLPRGWLREGVGSLARADAVVVTHAEMAGAARVGALLAAIESVAPGTLTVRCAHRWTGLVVHDDGRSVRQGVAWLSGRRCVGVCAIGNPAGFVAAARDACGGTLAEAIVLADHDPYKPATVERVIAAARRVNADAVVTTQKDWSKLSRVEGERWPCAVACAELGLVFDGDGGERLGERVVAAAAVG